ncbi:hypothetical protein CC2G_005759 [Coprinopsis cinerea AmutBmut pab1-1]|nr:hypothetical protein CC2G_005759 [Coprinopsis cinerea AmutBmut pab1-1]
MTSSKSLNRVCNDDVLDKLEELSIINIDSDEDDSPSYGSASLPTPEAPHVDFTVRASPYDCQTPVQYWYSGEYANSAERMEPVKPPGAPLLKDMDSFTEGTGCGSFEDLPSTLNHEDSDLVYPTTEETLSLLPPPDSLLAYIEQWRSDILEEPSLPVKRPRSPSPEDDRSARRTRPRIRAVSLPATFKAYTQSIGFCTTRSEPEAPD